MFLLIETLSQAGAPEFTMHLLAGCGATFFHDSVMTPADVRTQKQAFSTKFSLNAILISGDKAADANVLLSLQKCHLCLQGENLIQTTVGNHTNLLKLFFLAKQK